MEKIKKYNDIRSVVMNDLPIITITMGDPAGIGPEVILKALRKKEIHQIGRPVVIGDTGVLKRAAKKEGAFLFQEISDLSGFSEKPGCINVIPVSHLEEDSAVPGHPCIDGGKAMVDYIFKAVELVNSGSARAMATCPINKELMKGAGYYFDGHTDLLAHLTGTKDYVMMLAGERLRVALVTIHCALREVPGKLNTEGVLNSIRITCRALEGDFEIQRPRLAVAGLNPHAGEAGLFGDEEEKVIVPAVEKAKKEGIAAEGPFPPDTLFYYAAKGKYDAVVAMYHDQGLIPLKLLHFSDAVNITLGLPIIRTSVDHGTAYDIAGKGIADPSSLVAAINMAARMASSRKRRGPKSNPSITR